MTNNDELALKPVGNIFTSDKGEVVFSPSKWPVSGFQFAGSVYSAEQVNTLLAERDADKKRIAELEALTAEQDKRLVSYAAIATKNSSEARTVSVKLPKRKSAEDYVDENFNNSDLAAVYNACRWQCQVKIIDACHEAGIKLEVGE